MSDWPEFAFDLNEKFPPLPHAFVQWKGTDVCMDVRCICGDSFHIDSDFAYFLKCQACGRILETSYHIQLREVAETDPRIFSPKVDPEQVTDA